jgi:predicted DsbA family dithiol-disulfide isomerase
MPSLTSSHNTIMTSPAQPSPFTIDVVSDVVCPWCYIGKRKLETALALPEAAALGPVTVRWHPFQLNPDMPADGIPRQQYLADKFGGPERAAQIYERVRAAGRAAGLELNIDGIERQPNTLAAHALLTFAQQDGQDGSAVKEGILKAYFMDSRFIGDVEVLVDIAVQTGLDGQAARTFITDPQTLQQIAAADGHARSQGITGVPFFIFNGRVAVSGAQDPQHLLQAMQQAM